MRIVSLLPSATEIAFALGLGDELVGVTHECDYPPEARDIPVVTRRVLDVPRGPSHAIHRLVEGSLQAGAGNLTLDEGALAEAHPDLVLSQGACRVCALGALQVADAAGRLDGDVTILRLEPTSIEGILNAIQTVGAMTEAEDEAVDVVQGLRERLAAVEEIVIGRRDHGFAPPRVAAVSWLEPPYAVGRWVPEQVRLAGGWELLARDGEHAAETTWDAIREVDPEVLVLMPAGLHLPDALSAWASVERPAGWDELRAVRDGRVYAVDASAHFSRPGPRVVDGIEVLSELFDPLAFDGMSPPDSWARVG